MERRTYNDDDDDRKRLEYIHDINSSWLKWMTVISQTEWIIWMVSELWQKNASTLSTCEGG